MSSKANEDIGNVATEILESVNSLENSLMKDGYSLLDAEGIVLRALFRAYAIYLCIAVGAKPNAGISRDQVTEMFLEICEKVPAFSFEIALKYCKKNGDVARKKFDF